MKQYEVTHAPHFIGGRLRPVGAVVTLREGVKPGRYLKEVAAKADEPAKPGRKAKADEPADLPDA